MLEWLGLGVSFAVITPNPYTHSLIKQMRPDSRTVFLEMAFKKDVPTSSCYVLKRLLFVGTVYQRKGLLYLLEAIGQMSEKEIWILWEIFLTKNTINVCCLWFTYMGWRML